MRLDQLKKEKINESTELDKTKVEAVVKAAIDLNMSLDFSSISSETTRNANKLEKAIKNLGYNPRKKL